MNTVTRRTALFAAPLLATALVATGSGVAEASTVPAICSTRLRPLRAPALGTTTLRRGSRGPAVKSLQNLINHMPRLKNSRGKWYVPACPLEEDGAFGAQTESRLKDAQRAAGLTPDGVVGPATRKAANKYFRRKAR